MTRDFTISGPVSLLDVYDLLTEGWRWVDDCFRPGHAVLCSPPGAEPVRLRIVSVGTHWMARPLRENENHA